MSTENSFYSLSGFSVQVSTKYFVSLQLEWNEKIGEMRLFVNKMGDLQVGATNS